MPLRLTFLTLIAVEWGYVFLFLPVEEKHEEFKYVLTDVYTEQIILYSFFVRDLL
jgi:hypothetical protein